MLKPHPFRIQASNTSKAETIQQSNCEEKVDVEIGDSLESISFIGGMIDRLQTQVEHQTSLIASLEREIKDLTTHKEAAYSEMSKLDNALRAERARADLAEQRYQHMATKEREATEKIKRLLLSVRSTFGRTERAIAA